MTLTLRKKTLVINLLKIGHTFPEVLFFVRNWFEYSCQLCLLSLCVHLEYDGQVDGATRKEDLGEDLTYQEEIPMNSLFKNFSHKYICFILLPCYHFLSIFYYKIKPSNPSSESFSFTSHL